MSASNTQLVLNSMKQDILNLIVDYYHRYKLPVIKNKDAVLVFMDDTFFVRVEPVSGCVDCEHDRVKHRELVELRSEAKKT